MKKQLRDSAQGAVLSAESASGGTGQLKLRIRIMEGNVQGSSGYYPAEVLKKDGPGVFAKGTHMHLDHMSFWEMAEGSPGSMKSLVGFLDSDAVYETGADGVEGLYADAVVISKEAQFIKEVAPYIGVSILAAAEAESGISPATGKETDIITGIVGALSVDFVTHPGANGRIVQTLESNRNLWPEGFQFIKDHPAIESAGETKKGKPMAELSDEAVKALEELPALLAALTQAQVASATAAAEAAKLKDDESGPVDVVATVLSLTAKLQESDLPAAAQAKVLTAIQADPNLSPDDAIAAEKAYIESLTKGYTKEGGPAERQFGQLLIFGEGSQPGKATPEATLAAETRAARYLAIGKVSR